jgi:hypothetical protein
MLTAIIIKGNPKFVVGNEAANKFYNEIQSYLETIGYEVYLESAPKPTNLIIGHSIGVRRLRNYNNGVKLAFGALKKDKDTDIIFINEPKDEEYLRDCLKNKKYDYPIPEHFIFTEDMKKTIDSITKKLLTTDKFL